MSGKKCKHCGSSEIEVDPARGDAVCTSCGTVLEDNIIVAEVEFQESAHGGASAIGQFVSAETKGGATGFGRAFHAGIGQESREITLRKARDGITTLCQQLRLNQQCIDIACNFFKMALSRHLTIGRPASHTQAACVYMTCRTEGTAHLLIDISDALQICCYQLGRAYFRLSRALCINIPPTDPCLYILRFSSQLQLEDKQHEVSMTALRLVQRMKRDSIHSGRRPSGICGAALLIASRLHNFSRTPSDVVRIVKVHESTIRKRLMEFGETPSSALTLDEFMTVDLEEEQDPPAFRAARKRDKERLQKRCGSELRIVKVHESTIRKRLMEFGETPSSALTLDEFMTVDLEEEQDPPAFRAARKRDKERLQKLMEEEDGEKELTELQKEIDAQLEKDNSRRRKLAPGAGATLTPISSIVQPEASEDSEDAEASRFAAEDTLTLIGDIAKDARPEGEKAPSKIDQLKFEKGLGPELAVIGLGQPEEKQADPFLKPEPKQPFSKDLQYDELVLSADDEEYVSSLIMTDAEARHKTMLWHKVNAGYLRDQKIKEEMRAKEREEGKKKKVRGCYKKKLACNAATAGEAIEKMLAEKKISSKINYDILKSLDQPGTPAPASKPEEAKKDVIAPSPAAPVEAPVEVPASPVPRKRRKKPAAEPAPPTPATPAVNTSAPATPAPPTPAAHERKMTKRRKRRKKPAASPAPPTPATPAVNTSAPATPAPATPATHDASEDYDDDAELDATDTGAELSLAAMLRNGQDDDYYDYEEY